MLVFWTFKYFLTRFGPADLDQSTPLTCFTPRQMLKVGCSNQGWFSGNLAHKKAGFGYTPREFNGWNLEMMGFSPSSESVWALRGGSTKFQAETYPIVKPPTYMGKPPFELIFVDPLQSRGHFEDRPIHPCYIASNAST